MIIFTIAFLKRVGVLYLALILEGSTVPALPIYRQCTEFSGGEFVPLQCIDNQ